MRFFRKHSALFLLLFLFIIPSLSSEEPSYREKRRQVLLYGIDSELLELIGTLESELDETFNKELLSLADETRNIKIKVAVWNFFSKLKYKEAEETAIAQLQESSESDDLTVALIKFLGNIESEKGEEAIFPYIESESNSVASIAIKTLGNRQYQPAETFLIERLSDDSFTDSESNLSDLKGDIIQALGKLESIEALPTLLGIAENPDARASHRWYASEALGYIGDPSALPVLEEIYFSETGNSFLKVYALMGIGRLDDPIAEDILIEGLKDSFWRVRVAAAKILGEKKSVKSVPILIYKAERDPEKPVKVESIKAIAAIGEEKGVEFLIQFYQDSKRVPGERLEVLKVLLSDNSIRMEDAIKAVFKEEWDKKESWILNETCKQLSIRETKGLDELYKIMLTHGNYIYKLYAIRGVKKNKVASLYGKIKEMAVSEGVHPAIKREAGALLEQEDERPLAAPVEQPEQPEDEL